MNTIELPGCTPEPLMSYLKALGVFRLVAEDKEHGDPSARGCWRGGVFVLETTLDRYGLAKFFLEQYRPTPIVVPWSGGDFFGIKVGATVLKSKDAPTSTRIIEAILATTSPRLQPYRDAIQLVIATMAACGIGDKKAIEGSSKKSAKAEFIAQLRAEASEEVVGWVDAAAQVDDESAVFNPLLGSGGGNDGNTHFSDNFMQNLWDSLPDFDGQRKNPAQPKPDVRHALFNESVGILTPKRTAALYDSGAVGGPNASQGFIRDALVNPWDFILALEGLLIFAGGMAKRLGSHSVEAPSFPYLIRMTAAGSEFGSAALKEYGQNEVWLPMWERPATLGEVAAFFREGRAQVGRRPAQTGSDMARTVATKGVSAGIDEFRRYGLIRGRVGGENYFTATSIGSYRVRYDDSVTLLDQLDPWLTKFGYALRDEDTPARYRSAFRRLDAAIADYCRLGRQPGVRGGLLPVVIALGVVERTLAAGLGFCKDKYIRPLQGLSADWLEQADDGSQEFALAVSLAGIGSADVVGPLRAHLEEVEAKGDYVNWSPGSTSAVWSKRPLADNLAAVFRRRQMEAFRAGQMGVPLDAAPSPGDRKREIICPTPLAHVLAFLRGELDDEKLHDLIWGLAAIDWRAVERRVPDRPEPDLEIPTEFGLPRLLVNPLSLVPNGSHWGLAEGESEHATKHDPDVFHALAAGRGEAVERAARRLRSGGLTAAGHRNRQTGLRSLAAVSPHLRPGHSARLLASMLFPLSNRDLGRVADAVLYPPEPQE